MYEVIKLQCIYTPIVLAGCQAGQCIVYLLLLPLLVNMCLCTPHLKMPSYARQGARYKALVHVVREM